MSRPIWLFALLFAFFSFSFCSKSLAQTAFPPACGGPSPLAQTCSGACIDCGSLDGFSGTTSMNGQGQIVPGFCTMIFHSVKFVGFIAGSSSLSISVTVGACTLGNGIEMGIYKSFDCQNFQLVSNCNTAMSSGATYFFSTTQPLDIGCHYYLVFDNNGPAACQFTVHVVSGSTGSQPLPAPVFTSGPTAICPNRTAQFCIENIDMACAYEWTAPAGATINGQTSPLRLPDATGKCVTVKFGATGGPVCVRALNACEIGPQTCQNVAVAPIPPTVLPTASICFGQSFTWLNGQTYSNSQLLSLNFLTALGCDSLVQQPLIVRPPIQNALGPQAICSGDTLRLAGLEVAAAGSYGATFVTDAGCDSTVTFSVVVVAADAQIAPPDALDCLPDTVVLDGSASVGQTFSWWNPAGQMIGSGPQADAVSAGIFKLVAERSWAGKICRDTAQVLVNQSVTSPFFSLNVLKRLDCLSDTARILASSGQPNLTFLWLQKDSIVASGPSFSATVADSFWVIATNSSGCSASRFFEILEDRQPPVFALSPPEILDCKSLETTVLASAADSNLTFQFFENQVFKSLGPSFLATAAGLFSVVATAKNGCTSSQFFSVLEDKTPPDLAVSPPDILTCAKPATTVLATSATVGATFQFFDNQQNVFFKNPFSIAATGQFSVLATGANGCSSSQIFEVLENKTPPVFAVSLPEILTCKKLETEVSVSSSESIIDVHWIENQQIIASGATFLATKKGPFSVVATGANGCTATRFFEILEDRTPPDLAVSTPSILSCTNPATTVSASSTTSGATFQFFKNQQLVFINSTFSIASAGQFSIVATAPNGCSTSQNFEVFSTNDLPAVAAATSGPITCAQAASQISATCSMPNAVFSWLGPSGFLASGAAATALSAGLFSVTATLPSGCSASATVVVEAKTAQPDLFLKLDTLTCAAPMAEILAASTAAGAAFVFLKNQQILSNSATFQTSLAGHFTATVTDVFGCSASLDFEVLEDKKPPVFAVSAPEVLTCKKLAAEVSVLSSEPIFDVQWIDNQQVTSFGATFSSATAGLFSVAATGANGCSTTRIFDILEDKTPPNLVVSEPEILTCSRLETTVSASSATVGATFQFFENQQILSNSGSAIHFSQTGIFEVVATGPNGCTASQNFEILQDLAPPVFSVSIPEILTCSNPQTALAASSIEPLVLTQWLDNQQVTCVGPIFLASAAGPFSVVATGANGCSATQFFDILEDKKAPTITASGAVLDCSTGAASLAAASDAPNSFFTWTGAGGFFSTVQNPTVALAATYFLTVENLANGCTASASAAILTNPNAPSLALLADSLDCRRPTGQILAVSSAQNPSYAWVGPSGFSSAAAAISIDSAGLFFCTLTDVTGCKSTSYVSVAANFEVPDLAISAPEMLDCKRLATAVLASSQAAGATFEFFENGFLIGSGASFLASAAGLFSVVATGANGCSASQNFEVLEDREPPVLSISMPEILTCAKPTTTVLASSVTAGATVAFFKNQHIVSNNWSIEIDSAGQFLLVAMGPNGCTTSAAFEVLEDKKLPVFSISEPEILTCSRLETSVFLTSADTVFSTQWLDNQQVIATGLNFKSQKSGAFAVVATAPNGCSASRFFEILEDKKLPNLTVSEPEILGCRTRRTEVFVESATVGATFEIFKNQQLVSKNSSLEIDSAGLFAVVATGSNGCSASREFEVLEEGFGAWAVDLGPDTTVFWDSFLTIKAAVSLPSNGLERLEWLPKNAFGGGAFSFEKTVEMRRDRWFWIVAEDIFGCEKVDSIFVRVERPEIFVPNVFWPDGPDDNSRWTVFPSSEAIKIQGVRLFDRWGELVFFEKGPMLEGWDGHFRGKKMEPCVLVWTVAIELPDGRRRLLKGDLTVVR